MSYQVPNLSRAEDTPAMENAKHTVLSILSNKYFLIAVVLVVLAYFGYRYWKKKTEKTEKKVKFQDEEMLMKKLNEDLPTEEKKKEVKVEEKKDK